MNITTSFHIGTKPTKKTTSMYLSMQDRIAVIKETNFQSLFLLEYYLTVIPMPNYIMDDLKVAKATGFTLRSVQDHRRKLENKNLFCTIKTTGPGTAHLLYCARKEGVYCNKYFDGLFGCNTVREVYRSHTRQQIADVLLQNNMTPMETKDITGLLERYHDKKKKSGDYNHKWVM